MLLLSIFLELKLARQLVKRINSSLSLSGRYLKTNCGCGYWRDPVPSFLELLDFFSFLQMHSMKEMLSFPGYLDRFLFFSKYFRLT